MSRNTTNLPPGCLPGDIDRSDTRPERPEDFQKGCPCCGKAVDATEGECPVCKYQFEDVL